MRSRPNVFSLLLISALVLTVAEDGLAGKKNKKKKKNKQSAESSQPAKQPESAPAKGAPKVVRDVDKRLLAYDTAGARSLLAGEALESDPYLKLADGRVLEQEGQYAEATARLAAAADVLSADPTPLVHLGQAHLRAYNAKAADEAFRRAEQRARKILESSPDSSEALYLLGAAQQGLGNHAEALSSLQKARAASPGDALIVFQIGVTQSFQQNWQAAFDSLTQAIEMNSGIAYAYYYRGLAADKIGRKDLVVNDFNRFLALAPNAPEADQVRRLLSGL